jgi:ABC-type uncharacterized transport system involved in gliding motility auxiliary subunit
MTNWLGNEDRLIATQPRAVKDGAVTLSKTQLTIISGGFLIVVPMLLMLAGVVLWWRRRN